MLKWGQMASTAWPVCLTQRLRVALALSLGVAVLGLSACSQDADSAPPKSKIERKRELHLVELARAELRQLRLSQVHTGSLRARKVVRIHTQEAGRITTLPYFEGDRVAAGDYVLTLDSTLLATELTRAEAVRKEAQANQARLARLLKRAMIAEDEVHKAATALDVARAEEALLRTRLGYTRVVAPFAGVVSERVMEPGDIAERYQHVLTIIDPDSLVADLQVSELLMPHVRVGASVEVRIDALGDRPIAGEVVRVHPELDAITRQGRVEVTLASPPGNARPGQFARVRFELDTPHRLVIPFASLRRDTGGDYVFRLGNDDKVMRVTVRSGQRFSDRIEIVEGLSPGDQIVHRGFLGLNEGMTVKPVGDNDS